MSTPFWAPEHDVGAAQARSLIAGQFPHVSCRSIERFGAGMDNIAYLVDDRYVFRFPRRAIVAPLLETEAAILPLIAPRLPVPVPVPRFVGEAQGDYPWMFAGYERLDGTTACSVPLSDDDRSALAAPLGSFLRALHAIDPSLAISRGLPGDTLGRLDHQKRFPLAQERLADLVSGGYVDDARPYLDYMRRCAPRDIAPSSIVHGDLYARHILLDERAELAGVIDWGDVHFGHPAADLMAAYIMLPQSAHGAFIEAYGRIDGRTWDIAKYRAVYHSVLVAHYGIHIGDTILRDAGLTALSRIRPSL